MHAAMSLVVDLGRLVGHWNDEPARADEGQFACLLRSQPEPDGGLEAATDVHVLTGVAGEAALVAHFCTALAYQENW